MLVNAIILFSAAAIAVTDRTVIDFALLESAPGPPHDLDITQDHPFESYNIAYNTSWIITTHNGTSPLVWVHESRLGQSFSQGLARRQSGSGGSAKNHWSLGTGYSYANECPDNCVSWVNLFCRAMDENSCISTPLHRYGGGSASSWDIGEAGPSGHAGVAFFSRNYHCSGAAQYVSNERDGCAENLYWLSILPFAS
jgi:hypothetical protein